MAPRACVRVYARVLVPPYRYICYMCMHAYLGYLRTYNRNTLPACGQAVGCVVSMTRRSSGVAPCVRVYARVLVPPNLYIVYYIYTKTSP